MTDWLHKVQYYETDQMQIVHHANYIKWFEEARMHLLDGYDKMEEAGLLVPVLSVSAEYRSMTRFGEKVYISAKIKELTGVKLILSYEITDSETGKLRCTGESKHTFLNAETYRTVSLEKKNKEIFDLFKKMYDAQED
jgi:acyl-CoA thioester hydrolase